MQYKWKVIGITTVGTLMAGIDTRILVVGLPAIAQQLHASADESIWMGQAYLLTGTLFLLFVGRITDLFGKVKIFNLGFVIFTVGSIFCALSFNAFELIASRAVQGVGYAVIVANSASIITDSSPRNELGKFLGLNVTAWRVGAIAGLSLSGLILSFVVWRGLFYINIPIGILGTVWGYRELREIGTRDTSKKMDWGGFILFGIGLTSALLAITFFSYGISGSILAYSFLGLGIIFLAIFIKAESKSRFPLLDLTLFKIKAFAAGNLALLINGTVFSGFTLLIAFYFELGIGYTPLQSGVAIVPLEISFLILSLISGKLSDKYGSSGLSSTGLLISTVGILLVATFNISTPYPEVAIILSIIGVGNGLFMPPNTRAIMSSVPANRRGIANGFRSTMYNIGFASSYGLVILFITFGMPYNSFSLLLQGNGALSFVRVEFLNGFRIAALMLAILDGIAIIPSPMKGVKETPSSEV
ncbi:MAG: MFS transporter [Nitrososphaerales archaeon]